jgi:hypothetical protein
MPVVPALEAWWRLDFAGERSGESDRARAAENTIRGIDIVDRQ